MTATFVYDTTLVVHHVVVLQQTLTDTEVVFLNFLLCALNGLVDHRVLDYFILIESHTVHEFHDTLAGEQTHQLVLKRHEENRRAWVTLTTSTTTQLSVNTTALMTLCTDDGETSSLFHLGRELDVGTTTCHVGGDSHNALLSGLCHDVGLLLVELGIEHLMRNVPQIKHLRQHLTDFHRCGTYKHWTTSVNHLLDLGDDSLVLGTVGLIDAVVHVIANHRFVGRDLHHVEFVDIVKLACFGDGGTSHTGELVVHAEIVLKSNGGERLCGGFNLHVLLGLHCLVQSIAPTTAFHDTACLLIHNLHLSVDDDVVVVEFKECVCL